VAFALALGLLAGIFVGTPAVAAPAAPQASAASEPSRAIGVSLSGFIPGYIISDQLFYDRNALSAAQIQSFLTSMVGGCNTSTRCLDVATVNYPGRPVDVSARTGFTVCEAIAGGTMKISELIYRAQVACSISAKVILVTLQKEQGLVTSKSPSDYALSRAMGMACPDTAPCDPNALGLATQIVKGTAQLSCYKQCRFAKQPGVQYIQYDPDASCGGTTLNVQNYATAALYSYTPYQPNSSAIAAGYGNSSDPCASFGNRNFYLYYNDWFGNSLGGSPTDAIKSLHLVMGGPTGALGAVVEQPACASDAATCVWTFQHGVISFARNSGTTAAFGAIGDYWLANRTALGVPLAAETAITDPHGNGIAQSFQRGIVHSSTSGTFLVPSGLQAAYSAAGWLRGALGWPTSGPVCGGTAGGCVQTFQGGTASMTAAGVGNFMRADVLALYGTLGNQTGSLGFPTAGQTTVADPNGNGVVQVFDNGLIHASSRGAFVVPKNVMPAYSAAGWLRGSLGWPIGAYSCDASGCSQAFAGGVIRTAVDGTGAFVSAAIDPAVRAAYDATGGGTGPLGYPVSARTVVKDPNGDGIAQAFQGGIIHAGPAGAFAVSSAVMTVYSANGWLRGRLGWPIATAVCDSTGCTQDFAGGSIIIPTGQTGFATARIENAQIQSLYTSTGGATGQLGRPVSPQTAVTDPNGNGVAQVFEKGIVHVSAAGAFLVPTAVMPKYSAAGWVRGTLGWPTAAATCDATGCVQTFQHGTIDSH
jgi:uncharacterized protein with LGFP repeats